MKQKSFNDIYNDTQVQKRIKRLCKRYYERYREKFESIAWDLEDLEQEIWLKIAESEGPFVIQRSVHDMFDILKNLFRDCRDVDFDDIENYGIEMEDGEESHDEIFSRLVYHKKAKEIMV
jgi:DNA-directed RNA polymerase specialized sigma24 family protein